MSVLSKIKITYKGIAEKSAQISVSMGKNKALIMLDMLYCLLKYKASPNNYEKFEFYHLDRKKRNTYVTYGISKQMINKFNNPAYIDVFENKLKFAEAFSDMFNRDYLSVSKMSEQEFERFCQGKEKFICKPYLGSQGADIKVYHKDEAKDIYTEIKELYPEGFMLEEWIPQHAVLSEIYPDAVNCLRIITVFDGKETHLVTGGVTFGTETEIANGSQPSIVAPVDFKTGIMTSAATFGSSLYENHPKTKRKINGVKLPYWEETVALLNEACKRVPEVRYIGWDIAITPDGPVLIEGNTTPGYKYYQIPVHLVNGVGNKSKYIKYLR